MGYAAPSRGRDRPDMIRSHPITPGGTPYRAPFRNQYMADRGSNTGMNKYPIP